MPADVTLNAGAGGAIIATDPTTSSEHYQLIKPAYGAVGTFTLVTSAAGLPVASASSGLIQISGVPTVVVASSAGLTQTVTVLSASSGLVQASQVGTWTVQTTAGTAIATSSAIGVPGYAAVTPTSSIAGAALAPVTSSAGLLASLSSGTVSLSSQITVTATGPVTVTSGLISVTSGTITSTAATNPWSSAPGFNVPVVNASSGFIQLSSQLTVTATAATNPWSSTPGFNMPVVTVSSGFVQISGTPSVTATAGTNPWSSAPGFNVPVVNVSSGLVQAVGVVAASSGVPTGLAFANNITTGATALSVNVKGTPGLWFGYTLYNSTATLRSVKIYNTTSAPTVGSTASIVSYLPVPGSTGGGGSNMIFPYGVFCSNGIGYTITANAAATDTGAPGTNDVSLTLYYV